MTWSAMHLPSFLVVALIVAGCESCHDHDHNDHERDHNGREHDDNRRERDHNGRDPASLEGHDEHGHAHDDDSIGITRWTDKLELFAEHPPAVAGEALTFLAHLTLLEGFRAIEDAALALVLEGPDRVEARVAESLRPGIFQVVLTAPRPGTYRGRLVVTGPEVEDAIDAFEIVVHATAEVAKQAAAGKPEGGAEPTAFLKEPQWQVPFATAEVAKQAAARPQRSGAEPIAFLKEQQWQVPFATAFAVDGRIIPSIEVAGEITTPPSGQAEIGAAIAGRVVAPSGKLPRPGQGVRRGQLLATLAPAPAAPEAGAGADLAVVEAEARVQAARAAMERAERLMADRAISQREIDEAQREFRVAEEAVQATRRARDVFSGAASGRGAGLYRVRAPIEGVVVDVQATAGKSVLSGELLFRVVNLSELWIRARVPEQDASRLRADQGASFQLPGLDTWFPLSIGGEKASASVVSIGRTVDPRSRTVDVIYGLLEPDERLRVGAMVRVRLPVSDPWQGVVVPRGAVFEDDGRALVYVQIEGESFEERTVRLGPRSGSHAGIERGIAAGERVVTHGGNVVRLSARAGSVPAHGHVH